MTTTTQPNDQKQPATVPQILAQLILLGQGRELPDPKSMDAHEDHMRVEIRVRDRAAFNCWIAAIGAGQEDIQGPGMPRPDGTALSWVLVWDWHAGWRVSVELAEASVAPTVLDADTVAGLEAVAAPADSRIANDEPCEPEPECDHQAGCPKHGNVYDCDPMPAEQFAIHAGPYDVPAVQA